MRIRTLKPEFWSDEKLSPLEPIHRLVFLALIGAADDYGRLLDNLKMLDAHAFPNTDDSVGESLEVLDKLGRIRRGESASGQKIIEILNWSKHQRVDKPQVKAALPAIEFPDSRESREPFANDSRMSLEPLASRPTTNDQGSTTKDLRSKESSSSEDFFCFEQSKIADVTALAQQAASVIAGKRSSSIDFDEWRSLVASFSVGLFFGGAPRTWITNAKKRDSLSAGYFISIAKTVANQHGCTYDDLKRQSPCIPMPEIVVPAMRRRSKPNPHTVECDAYHALHDSLKRAPTDDELAAEVLRRLGRKAS